MCLSGSYYILGVPLSVVSGRLARVLDDGGVVFEFPQTPLPPNIVQNSPNKWVRAGSRIFLPKL